MSRHMSCSLTVDAVRDRTKTVTRREAHTWELLKPGDRLTLVEKAMGLPKGSKQVVLAEVEVTGVRVESLRPFLTQTEVDAEGLPDLDTVEFIDFWLHSHRYPVNDYWRRTARVRRIEWRYLDDEVSQ